MEKQQVLSGDYWKEQMLIGNFDSAWKFSDGVLEKRKGKPCWHLPRHQQYIWDGSSLQDKTVLVRCYHGLGDTIQFIRYAPLLKKIAKQVIVWAQEPLMPLLETVDGIDALLPLHDGAPEIEYDVDIEVMELPHVFRTRIETIPQNIPYIHVDPPDPLLTDKKFKAGLVWKVGDWDESRTIPFSTFLPLFDLEGVSMYILQSDPVSSGWTEGYGIYPGSFNLYEYARIIKSLDLVITVDSMPAHLAGAQGVPVWTLLKKEADWRWMKDRQDSPWYPTMKLFRQQHDDDWSDVIDKVMADLARLSS